MNPSFAEADAVCWLVEAGDRRLRDEDAEVLRALSVVSRPIVLVVNKADAHDPGKGRPICVH